MLENKRLRVLWLIKALGPGGAERLLVSSAAVADHERFSYEAAYVLAQLNMLVPELEGHGVPVHCLGVEDARDLRWALRLRHLLAARRFDVVHIHSPLVAGVARLAVRSLPKPERARLVTTHHNVWSNYALVSRALTAMTFRSDDAHLAVSEAVRNSFPDWLRPRVEVREQGIPLADVRALVRHRDETRAELGVGPGEVLVTTVANLRREKDYPNLLQAARTVLDAGLPVRFVAVGRGPAEQEVRRLHRALRLGDRFRLLGYREDAVRLVAASDLFVLASFEEGFPIAIMEALAVGVAAVATAVGGIPTAITDGVQGFVVPPRRPDLLADRIARLVRDAGLRERMGAAAASAADAYDIRHAVRRSEELYRTVTMGRWVTRAAKR